MTSGGEHRAPMIKHKTIAKDLNISNFLADNISNFRQKPKTIGS
jgi:hypothetical protein